MSDWNKQIANALMGYAKDDPSTIDVRNRLMDVVTNRATFFPAADYADGSTRWAWPGAIYEPAAAFSRMMQGDMSPQNALPVAGGVALGGMGRAPVRVPPDRDVLMARRMMQGEADAAPTIGPNTISPGAAGREALYAERSAIEAGYPLGRVGGYYGPDAGGSFYARTGNAVPQRYNTGDHYAFTPEAQLDDAIRLLWNDPSNYNKPFPVGGGK